MLAVHKGHPKWELPPSKPRVIVIAVPARADKQPTTVTVAMGPYEKIRACSERVLAEESTGTDITTATAAPTTTTTTTTTAQTNIEARAKRHKQIKIREKKKQ